MKRTFYKNVKLLDLKGHKCCCAKAIYQATHAIAAMATTTIHHFVPPIVRPTNRNCKAKLLITKIIKKVADIAARKRFPCDSCANGCKCNGRAKTMEMDCWITNST